MDTDDSEETEIEDIDREDRSNPQLVCEYVNEIYAYMRKLESDQAVAENYLKTFGNKSG